jgi:hypothetical protein
MTRAAYYILNCYQCVTAIIFSWSSANTAGHTKKTSNTAFLYIGLCVGVSLALHLLAPCTH